MKKLLFIALSVLLFFCKDAEEKANEISDSIHDSDRVVAVDSLLHKEKPLKIDTLNFEKLKATNQFDKVLAMTLKKEFTKDSIEVTVCRLDFYLKDKLMYSFPVIGDTSEEGEWSLYEEPFQDNNRKNYDNRFFEMTYGYPACGYTQSNFLFFIENGKLQLIKKHNSSADGPYGDWLEFEPTFAGNKIVSFSSKKVQINSDESKPYNDENEDLVRTFSDSVVYNYNGEKWSGKLKTPKNKIFRTEHKTFKQLYSQE